MNNLNALIVFSLTICFLSCGEKVVKKLNTLGDGIIILSFEKDMDKYIMDDFMISWIENCYNDIDSIDVVCISYYSNMIVGDDTVQIGADFIACKVPFERLGCNNPASFRENDIPQSELKILTCERNYPNIYSEYKIIWKDSSSYDKFKRIYLNDQFTLTLTGDFREGKIDEITKRKIKELFKSLDVTYQSE